MAELQETVEWNGRTLYAPVLACRPVRPKDYDPKRLAVWNRVMAGAKLAIYPGSIFRPCPDCAIEIAIGPRQQETEMMAQNLGLAAHVICMACAADRAKGATDDGAEVGLGSLGNPFKRA